MGMNEWGLKITKVDNGYLLQGQGDPEDNPLIMVIEEQDEDELYHHEHLLWEIMEYFNFQGSKHDPERIRIVREKSGDYEEQINNSEEEDQEILYSFEEEGNQDSRPYL